MKWIIRTVISAGAALTFGALLASAVSADTSNTNSNTQTGSNTASSVQTVASVSGMATASGQGSTATSGAATAAASSYQTQRLKQKAANQVAKVPCECALQLPWASSGDTNTTNSNTNAQTGAQLVGNQQSAAAASLDANASGQDSVATTGDSTSLAESIQEQILKQFALNQGLFAEPEEAP